MANRVDTHPGLNILKLIKDKKTAIDVEMNHFGTLDFITGTLEYTCDDEDEDEDGIQKEHTLLQVIGTSGLGACSAVVVLTQTRAIVAHYSADLFIEEDFTNYLKKIKPQLANAKAWIMHQDSEGIEPRAAAENGAFNNKLYVSFMFHSSDANILL